MAVCRGDGQKEVRRAKSGAQTTFSQPRHRQGARVEVSSRCGIHREGETLMNVHHVTQWFGAAG